MVQTRNKINFKRKIQRRLNKDFFNNLEKEYYIKYPWKRTLKNIKQRCDNSNNPRYKDYGSRGIECKIIEEELKFLWFRDKAYNMKKPSIDREDNDGNYELSNCRFIEKGQNSAERNTRVSSKPILQYSKNGMFIKEWKSATQVMKVLNISTANINSVLKNKTKTAGLFIWRYKNE